MLGHRVDRCALILIVLGLALGPGLNFAAYVVRLRDLRWCQRERGILLYHLFWSAALSVLALVAALALGSSGAWAAALAAVSCQGIYSLSFLEAWSLTQGSHSIGILASAASAPGGVPREGLIASHVHIGDEKKAYRLIVVESLGLVRLEGERVALTRRGRWFAAFLALLHWIAKLDEAQ